MTTVPNNPTQFFRRRIVVLAAGLAAMLLAAAGVWLGWRELPDVPVREVLFASATGAAFIHVNGDDLARVARAVAAKRISVLRADLSEVRAAVEQIDWVRRADVRRRLPDKIEIRVEEQVPVAVWRNVAGPTAMASSEREGLDSRAVPDQLINRFGEVFKGSLPDRQQAALPLLIGPAEASKDVLAGLEQFGMQLAVIGREMRELRLSVRRAWTIKLDNRMTLEVGRSDAELRLARFVQAYRQTAALQAPGAQVDLRYQNGLAIRTASLATPISTLPAQSKAQSKIQTRVKRT